LDQTDSVRAFHDMACELLWLRKECETVKRRLAILRAGMENPSRH
jgi:hypothetical protein